jgi:hypothetical protein
MTATDATTLTFTPALEDSVEVLIASPAGLLIVEQATPPAGTARSPAMSTSTDRPAGLSAALLAAWGPDRCGPGAPIGASALLAAVPEAIRTVRRAASAGR